MTRCQANKADGLRHNDLAAVRQIAYTVREYVDSQGVEVVQSTRCPLISSTPQILKYVVTLIPPHVSIRS
jgi:hypothetical protein